VTDDAPEATALGIERDVADAARLLESARRQCRRRLDPSYAGPVTDPALRAMLRRAEAACDRLTWCVNDLADLLAGLEPDLKEERAMLGEQSNSLVGYNLILDLDTE
jgi:hypothetical protein